ncbi:MAG: hypothetical protein COB23_07055 [Methylophaga sp.]|nr:MAG: hypothetical protein COB23_07055 [Methylophaga sp.]
MKPNNKYIISAVAYSFACALLFSYPASSVFRDGPWAPEPSKWILFTIIIGGGLSVYSALAKAKILLSINWLVITGVNILVLYICHSINPGPVGDNLTAMGLATIFIFGAPLWLLLITLIFHIASCLSLTNDQQKNT